MKPCSEAGGALAPPSSSCCTVELSQRAVPSFVPPPPFSGLLAHLMAKQVC